MLKKVKRMSIIYTEKFKVYDGLVRYGFSQERVEKSISFTNGKVKRRFLKFYGVSKKNLVYYLKRLDFSNEFRYSYIYV